MGRTEITAKLYYFNNIAITRYSAMCYGDRASPIDPKTTQRRGLYSRRVHLVLVCLYCALQAFGNECVNALAS